MLTHVEFRSDMFPALEGEEELINPDLWGKRLADFLRAGLKREGIATEEPIAEDWGWVVPVVNTDFRLWVGCGRYQQYQDGFLLFIEPHKPFVTRLFRRIRTEDRIAEVQSAIDKMLSKEPGIREIRWWSYAQFNRLSTRDDIRTS